MRDLCPSMSKRRRANLNKMYCSRIFFIILISMRGVICAIVPDLSKFNNTDYEAFHSDYLDFYNETEVHSTAKMHKSYSSTEKSVSETINKDTSGIKELTTMVIETNSVTTQAPSHHGHLAFIDKILSKYDKRAWPTYGTTNPTVVAVNIYINSLGSISAASMDFGMDIYLRQSWTDPRLEFSHYGINETVTLNGQDLIDKIWTPDLFFRNLKSGNFHSVTVPNKLIKLSPNGAILFSMRLTLRLSCHMSFRLYPLDTQRCWIILGSYAQTADQVLVKWREESPITVEKEIEVPEFRAFLQQPHEFMRDIDTGSFSFLNVSFVFVRQNGYHLIQTYLPTFLLVMVSWVSFWVPVEAAPARVALGVTTLLSLVTVASGIRSQLPPVSYAKAIDIWIGACSVMVFTSLIEFALASYLNRMKVHHKDNSCIIFNKTKRDMTKGEIEAKIQSAIPHTPEMIRTIQRRRSHTVDRLSRMIFPLVFLIFNMFYWIFYLSQRARQRERLL